MKSKVTKHVKKRFGTGKRGLCTEDRHLKRYCNPILQKKLTYKMFQWMM